MEDSVRIFLDIISGHTLIGLMGILLRSYAAFSNTFFNVRAQFGMLQFLIRTDF